MLIAYDLGTGGVKASLHDHGMATQTKSFIEYPTYYPAPKRHEQSPESWWVGVVASTRALLQQSGVKKEDITCLALSGHSLVAVPVDRRGQLLQRQVPIWSDSRAEEQARSFFQKDR